MPDAFDMLRSADRWAEPDAAFRAHLIDEMDRTFDAVEATLVAPSIGVSAMELEPITMFDRTHVEPPSNRRPVRFFTLLVSAAAVTALVGAVVVARSREATPPPVNNEAPAPATPPPVNNEAPAPATTSTTVPFDAVAAAAIGEAILLTPSEYAPNIVQMDFKDVVLDRSIAADVPGCSAFLDTVFESPDRPAATAFNTFYSPLPATLFQYVVVFSSDDAAKAMFDATVAPTFHDGCFQPYLDRLVELNGVDCCNKDEPIPPPLRGQPIATTETLGADDIQFRLSDDQTYTYLDQESGRETFEEATVRAGRVIVIIEAITQDELGNPVISEDQFHSAVAATVAKARAALEGSPD
jgi:hypothetical protein